MLVTMLSQSPTINELPLPQKTIILTLAKRFEQSPDYLFLDPTELYESTGLGSKEQWQELLNLQETQNYIKAQMAAIAQISQRKTFKSLVEMALSGNQQAAKQVQELSGIMNQMDNNKIIILHHVPRPITNVETKPIQGGN